jgi:hypothetical protein
VEADKYAAIKIIEMIDDDSWVVVVVFNSGARTVVPPRQTNPSGKSDAIERICAIQADGGTNISTGLLQALREFDHRKVPDGIRHVLFLTDGQNNTGDNLHGAVQQCAGRFQADCRGVGDGWHKDELLTISDALLGTTMVIPNARDIESDFRDIVQRAMSKAVKEAYLRLWVPKTVLIERCEQVYPQLFDLATKAQQVDAQTREYPLGAWSLESRDIRLVLQVASVGDIGVQACVCRPSIVYQLNKSAPREVLQALPIKVRWTTDKAAQDINERVAHYTGQTQLRDTIKRAIDLQEAGRNDEATVEYGKAVKSAYETNHAETIRRLGKVVEIIDGPKGTVRLRSGVAKVDKMDLDLGSVRTSRTGKTDQTDKTGKTNKTNKA